MTTGTTTSVPFLEFVRLGWLDHGANHFLRCRLSGGDTHRAQPKLPSISLMISSLVSIADSSTLTWRMRACTWARLKNASRSLGLILRGSSLLRWSMMSALVTPVLRLSLHPQASSAGERGRRAQGQGVEWRR